MTGRGWAYTGAILGGAVSIAANVAHSYVPPELAPAGWMPETGAVFGAVFWPVALFVAIEILARVGWPSGRRWVAVRYLGLLPVAVVAAVVSYRHLSGLLAFYGEDPLTVAIGPLAVDGLMVMATGALIATGAGRATVSAPVAKPVTRPATERTPARTPRRTSKPDTAAAVARLRDRHPDLSVPDMARRLRLSDRTVRRHLSDRPATLSAVRAGEAS
ncbi:MAG TPA: hypothetical protein VGR21_03575 [Cryptosporangiaceae bacterium]|nr:hypothetical protein [Cryptosporangiaceae bacterium]